MLYPEDAACAYAAQARTPGLLARHPHEEFLAGTHGRDQNNEAELAFGADGKIVGFRVNIVVTSAPGAAPAR